MRALLLLAWMLGAGAALAAGVTEMDGTVRRVADGDSYFVDVGQRKWIEVRVRGIDSPEKEWAGRWKAQPHGDEARVFADRLLAGHKVHLEIVETDRYGRSVGEVFVDGRSMSREMVRAGLAWWNPRYAPRDQELQQLQEQAKLAKRGLWADAEPVAPWKYRGKK